MIKTNNDIIWPDEFHPDRAPIHVRNELPMSVSPEFVWTWLIRAAFWPQWYPNAKNVTLEDGDVLKMGTIFRWKTFGVSLVSKVAEYSPHERIAWTAKGMGVWVYHAWRIKKTGTGCQVITEETQYGWACRLGNILYPGRMAAFHQIWLERLHEKAKGGV